MMSVELTRFVEQLYAPGRISSPVASAEKKSQQSDFTKIMEQIQEQGNGAKPTVEETLALVRMTQIQMMHGLFSDEESSEEPFFNFDEIGSLSLLGGNKSRFVDSYIKAQQPSLSQPQLSPREQIDALIDKVAERVKLAPELIRSVVAAESSFNPNAVSRVGAQGLMQLMPATAQDLGVKNSFDPQENLDGGSRYLKQLLDKYDGDLDHALAAYNWGQGNVDRHGLERMPTETRNYIAKIKQLLQQNTA